MSFLEPRVSFPSNFESFFSVMRHSSFVLFYLKLYMLWKKTAHLSAIFQSFKIALKLTKLLMSFFNPRVSFPLTFASSISVIIHNSYEIFYLKHYMLWTKRPHQSTVFQTFEYSNESSSNSSYHFWNHKVRVFQILHYYWVSWKITPMYIFSSNLI